MNDCVFCDYQHKQPDRVLRDWYDALVIAPLNPVVRGHVLIVPKAHVRHAGTDSIVTASVFARAAEWAGRQAWEPFNLITSAGQAATQTVFHLHVHYVPRTEGDGLLLPWSDARQQEGP